jgi:hypothetical protein
VGPFWGGRPIATPFTMGFPQGNRRWGGSPIINWSLYITP